MHRIGKKKGYFSLITMMKINKMSMLNNNRPKLIRKIIKIMSKKIILNKILYPPLKIPKKINQKKENFKSTSSHHNLGKILPNKFLSKKNNKNKNLLKMNKSHHNNKNIEILPTNLIYHKHSTN